MKIINPLYDKAFKYLMQNERIAIKVLSVILDQEVLDISLSQQETVVPDETRALTLFRLDFNATIKQPDGSKKQILIELQKSKYDTDIRRFRNYLAANYISKYPKKEIRETNNLLLVESELMPIVTIYILGYKLDDLPYLAVTVNNQIINSIDKQPLTIESFFVNMLTHQSHILQVTRLPKERQTRLEKFLTLFNQAWYADQKYILDLKEVPEEFIDIAEYLQIPVMNEEFRRQLAGEEELDAIFDQQEAKYIQQIEEERRQKDEALAKEKKAKEKEKEAKAKEKEAKAKEKEAKTKEKEALKKLYESVRLMKRHNISIDIIMNATGLEKEIIEEL